MVGVRKFSASSTNSKADARFVPHSVVLATEPLVIGPACTVQVPSWAVNQTLMYPPPATHWQIFQSLSLESSTRQAARQLGRRQILRLDGFERRDIFLKRGSVRLAASAI